MDKDYDIFIGDDNAEHKGFYVYNKPRMFKCNDRRNKKYKKFKKENGFTPDETWSLYASIAVFVIPRLKYFRENTCCYPPPFKIFLNMMVLEIFQKNIWLNIKTIGLQCLLIVKI